MNGDTKFSRELCMGMPNSLGNFAWGRQIPCSVGDTKSTEGVPKSLGDLARGCRIPYDTGDSQWVSIYNVCVFPRGQRNCATP